MTEGSPQENIYFIPERFEFSDYFNEFFIHFLSFQTGKKFSEILKDIKVNPIISVEEYLNKNKGRTSPNYYRLMVEFKKYPAKMKRLDEVVNELNFLKENEEDKFKKLINEAHSLILKN